jgi:hypothetical protein
MSSHADTAAPAPTRVYPPGRAPACHVCEDDGRIELGIVLGETRYDPCPRCQPPRA